jgi:E3 ubiquitin-protein ligase UHRF1
VDILYEESKYFAGKLGKMKKDKSLLNQPNNSKNDGLIYSIEYERCEKTPLTEVKLPNILPRAYHTLPFTELKLGEIVFMNYNINFPTERGILV